MLVDCSGFIRNEVGLSLNINFRWFGVLVLISVMIGDCVRNVCCVGCSKGRNLLLISDRFYMKVMGLFGVYVIFLILRCLNWCCMMVVLCLFLMVMSVLCLCSENEDGLFIL